MQLEHPHSGTPFAVEAPLDGEFARIDEELFERSGADFIAPPCRAPAAVE
jgi:hypothetical protein